VVSPGIAFRFAGTYCAALPIGVFQILLLAKGCFSGSRVPAVAVGDGEGDAVTVTDGEGDGEGETLTPPPTSQDLTTPGTGSLPNAVLLQPILLVAVFVM
jgi:hypothetical protein